MFTISPVRFLSVQITAIPRFELAGFRFKTKVTTLASKRDCTVLLQWARNFILLFLGGRRVAGLAGGG